MGFWDTDLCASLVNYSSIDTALCHPFSHHQTRWACSDDENIDVAFCFVPFCYSHVVGTKERCQWSM